MEVTEVKVKLVEANRDRLKAFCTITLDREFVVRDLKLIEGTNGLFVAMPSRKLADRCPSCGGKNHLRARHCNNCGAGLDDTRGGTDRDGRPKLHADIAHPINSSCRERIQKAVESAYHEEVERSKQPGYRPASLDEDDTDYAQAGASEPAAPAPAAAETEAEQDAEAEADDSQGSAETGKRKFGEGIV
ncbi:MAG: stage V sporulation protein G [Anaerolineaceae bacterium]|nr:stage V sporulation protein G [Anaerolineaceae bacterium]